MSCNGGRADGETKKLNGKSFFQQKCFWSEPKTFASFSDVLFVKEHEGNKCRNTKKLIKNFKLLFCFSRFVRAKGANWNTKLTKKFISVAVNVKCLRTPFFTEYLRATASAKWKQHINGRDKLWTAVKFKINF